MNIIPPSFVDSVVDDDGVMTQRLRTWSQEVSGLAIIEGSGSPEGVVNASVTKMYMDTGGASGSVLYIKQLSDIGGDGTKGWVLV